MLLAAPVTKLPAAALGRSTRQSPAQLYDRDQQPSRKVAGSTSLLIVTEEKKEDDSSHALPSTSLSREKGEDPATLPPVNVKVDEDDDDIPTKTTTKAITSG
eukprot:GSA25T00001032001.1